ncbi:hypothetical protein NsoK4_03275 [Nitrosopumilus sp. K4]|uniref:hypothetical protein n=1 Tax=Nitrosopumilus sp. K4 TaxID=2795383 RepID=UPI001BAE0D85|nr:hypothetical protein [Nitrosopumilus sp. K4]QUC65284.1 hypothetical protein NsoK4_03275 [Nitrosopumilus sp. K4]
MFLTNEKKLANKGMTRCKKCGKEYQLGTRNFCSQLCYEADIQNRIIEASMEDPSHTKRISKE